jgi:hypothetical protein
MSLYCTKSVKGHNLLILYRKGHNLKILYNKRDIISDFYVKGRKEIKMIDLEQLKHVNQ